MHNIPTPLLNLQTQLQAIPDPRTGRARRHELLDLLLISLCASLCGAQTFTDIALFGRCQQEWFKTWLALPHGIPSHDPFNRVFGLINPPHFRAVVVAWTQSLRHTIAGEVVAVDGKSLRGSAAHDHEPVHLVNVWASANCLILGQWKVADHSNEITALPALLRALELAGCTVTVAALNCQKNVAKEISEAEAETMCWRSKPTTVVRCTPKCRSFSMTPSPTAGATCPTSFTRPWRKRTGGSRRAATGSRKRLLGWPTNRSGRSCAAWPWAMATKMTYSVAA
jgi:hypothetical protein